MPLTTRLTAPSSKPFVNARSSSAMDLLLSGLTLCTVLCLVFCAASCKSSSGDDQAEQESIPTELAAGLYKVSYGMNYDTADEQKLLAVTAAIDRSEKKIIFTMQDSSQKVLSFTARDKSQWTAGCLVIGKYYLEEVADLTPGPLHIESLVFDTPLVRAVCSPNRMVLTTTLEDDPSEPALIFDLVE